MANPGHYADMIAGRSTQPVSKPRQPTGEVGGINYHPPPAIARLARVQGGFKVKGR